MFNIMWLITCWHFCYARQIYEGQVYKSCRIQFKNELDRRYILITSTHSISISFDLFSDLLEIIYFFTGFVEEFTEISRS